MKKIKRSKRFAPSDTYTQDIEIDPIPISADGGPPPGFGVDALPIQSSFDESLCRQGPCRHYWHLVTEFPSGNPESTWQSLGMQKPRQHNHVCLVNPGTETDLQEDFVYECSRWDPMPQHEKQALDTRRLQYHQRQAEPSEGEDHGS